MVDEFQRSCSWSVIGGSWVCPAADFSLMASEAVLSSTELETRFGPMAFMAGLSSVIFAELFLQRLVMIIDERLLRIRGIVNCQNQSLNQEFTMPDRKSEGRKW